MASGIAREGPSCRDGAPPSLTRAARHHSAERMKRGSNRRNIINQRPEAETRRNHLHRAIKHPLIPKWKSSLHVARHHLRHDPWREMKEIIRGRLIKERICAAHQPARSISSSILYHLQLLFAPIAHSLGGGILAASKSNYRDDV